MEKIQDFDCNSDGHISADLLVGESALNEGQCVTAARRRERRLGAEFQEVNLKESTEVDIVERCHVTLTTSF